MIAPLFHIIINQWNKSSDDTNSVYVCDNDYKIKVSMQSVCTLKAICRWMDATTPLDQTAWQKKEKSGIWLSYNEIVQ